MEVKEKKAIKGGEFLLTKSDYSKVFTPEDYTEEQNMFRSSMRDFLNKEVEERFKKTGVLENLDWDSGDICWHIETVNTHPAKLKEIYKWTAERLSTDISDNTKYVYWLRMNKSGKGIKRFNKIKISTGVNKFLKGK